ncbi:VOC family protein [Ornithinibacillus bavariensis]|uniref:Glyoxalase n=1 Tax=Ornithinibacillus bavariensis TaxID=545502 RepID=A0A919X4Y4_9BACI|nr:VOC family protein [Ornithinibacillus bavariensis]GIO25606.1 glyoxalase [Ornithinibacillus bavariensis]HAM79990.1 glyoxalase [Ornithinibacillus sp.]
MNFYYEKFDHVQIAAPKGSEEIAREFYQGILKFAEVEKPANLQKRGGAWFSAGNIHIHVGIEEPFYPAKKAHPAILVNNLKGFMDYLDTKKVSYTVDENLPGAQRFYLADPFGNRLEFLEWD